MSADQKQGKVEIKIGNLTFSGEGDQSWLSEQLSKVIEAAAPAIATSSKEQQPVNESGATTTTSKAASVSLASYLKSTGGDTKQVKRFLATAAWLYRRDDQKPLTSAAIAAALSENHQKRLANPADCLNQNCSKGFCEKTKGGFFITPEGWQELGEAQ